jgi:hypothetical protein
MIWKFKSFLTFWLIYAEVRNPYFFYLLNFLKLLAISANCPLIWTWKTCQKLTINCEQYFWLAIWKLYIGRFFPVSSDSQWEVHIMGHFILYFLWISKKRLTEINIYSCGKQISLQFLQKSNKNYNKHHQTHKKYWFYYAELTLNILVISSKYYWSCLNRDSSHILFSITQSILPL